MAIGYYTWVKVSNLQSNETTKPLDNEETGTKPNEYQKHL